MRQRRAPADLAAHAEAGGLLSQYYWIAVLAVLCVLGFLAAIAWWVRRCRHGGARYEYSALEDESNQQERLELQRKAQRSAAREKAHTACQAYLRKSGRYILLEQLNDIGSRFDKHWFVVKDESVKTERLLTMVPNNSNSPIQCTNENCELLQELFQALQHPYIYPILDLVFKEIAGKIFILCVLPINCKGSLKDLIYRSCWQDEWNMKYSSRCAGLPLSQVQRLGRQILEALLFLKDRGFSPYGHLHSGNVILQNGVARLAGVENTLLGHASRVQAVIWGRSRCDASAVDILCFGHVLFEMCAGYELCTPKPTPSHIMDIQEYPQVQQVLEFIFYNPNGRYPSLEEIIACDFFRNLDLRELRNMPIPQAFQARLTPELRCLLNEAKVNQKGKRSGRRSHSASTCEPRTNMSPSHAERRSSSPIASTSRICAEELSYASFPSTPTSAEEEHVLSRSPVPSLYVTPHASMSGLLDRSSDSPTGDTCSEHDDTDTAADDEQSDYSPVKEHRPLRLHVIEAMVVKRILSSPDLDDLEYIRTETSCLTHRLPSTS